MGFSVQEEALFPYIKAGTVVYYRVHTLGFVGHDWVSTINLSLKHFFQVSPGPRPHPPPGSSTPASKLES